MVPEVGLEPTLCCQNWILNPARLPISPLRHGEAQSIAELIILKSRKLFELGNSRLALLPWS